MNVELSESKRVMRLLKRSAHFFPPGERRPNGEAFRPSSADKLEADTKGQPIRVSVWDCDLTTVDQARSFRTTSEELTIWYLKMEAVAAIKRKLNASRLKVLSDPIPPPCAPGGAGHAGVEGLDQVAGETRLQNKALLDALSQALEESVENH